MMPGENEGLKGFLKAYDIGEMKMIITETPELITVKF
jgi:hypothetical protein